MSLDPASRREQIVGAAPARSARHRRRRPAAAPRSLGEAIYGRIRHDIVGCVYVPGETCSESQLAEAYGVGKAPVRWALAALSREGLVIARPRQGHTVAPVTLESGRPLLPRRIQSDRLHLESVRQAGQFAELVYSVRTAR